MSNVSPNPYQPPEERGAFVGDPKPGAPPITPVRLVIGLVLIAMAWIVFWAHANRMFIYGHFIFILCYSVMWRTTDHYSQRGRGAFMWRHVMMLFVLYVVVMGLVWFRDELPTEVKSALKDPVTFFVGGGMSCWILLADWRARRNNPPHQPEPQTDLSAANPWQRFARSWNIR